MEDRSRRVLVRAATVCIAVVAVRIKRPADVPTNSKRKSRRMILPQFVPVGHAQLDTSTVDMTFDCAHRHRELLGDLAAGQSRRDEGADFTLTGRRRKRLCRISDRWSRRSAALRRQTQCARGRLHRLGSSFAARCSGTACAAESAGITGVRRLRTRH